MDSHSLKHAQGKSQTRSAISSRCSLGCFHSCDCPFGMQWHGFSLAFSKNRLKRSIMEDLIDSVAVHRFILARSEGSKNQGY